MKNGMKKFWSWALVTLMLLTSVLSPMGQVWAAKTVEASKAKGDYEELAKIWYLIQEADACINTNNVKNATGGASSGSASITITDSSARRFSDFEDFWKKFNFEYFGSFVGGRKLFNESYLEKYNTGSLSDSTVGCNELKNANLLETIIKAYDLDRETINKDLICGVDGKKGLFNITLTYMGTSALDWLNRNPNSDQCGLLYDKLNEVFSNGPIKKPDGISSEIVVSATINNDFDIEEFFKKYTGNFDDIEEALIDEAEYLNFTNVCEVSQIDKDVYEDGKDEFLMYPVYHNGLVKYYRITKDADREIYVSTGNLNNIKKTTCRKLAESLAPENSMSSVEANRKARIADCVQTAKNNLEKLELVKLNIGYLRTGLNTILSSAQAFKDRGYTPNSSDAGFDLTDSEKNALFGYAANAGGGNLNDIVNSAISFADAFKSYASVASGALPGDLRSEYDSTLGDYQTMLSSADSVFDQVINKYQEASEKYQKAEQAVNRNWGLDDVYTFDDEENLECLADDAILSVVDDVQDITGGVVPGVKKYTPPEWSSSDSDGSQNESEDECYARSSSLGWILCPVIGAVDGIGSFMWKQAESFLQVPAEKTFASDGGVAKGWGIVRNIANIAFIILFLVVIFSQLTGIGIDNYGIKKILPRLIVIAILVNLSYLLCQIAVDLSNILGQGLNDMLSGWAINGASNTAVENDGSGGWALAGLLGGGGAAVFALFASSGWSIAVAGATLGVAVLGFLLTIVVAVAVLFLILFVREAGIILAVVIAPIAIVGYALPNTEKISKKWLDLFKALLLVYPICGAMVGAGKLAGSVLASIGTDGMSIAAGVVQVLPFFFIPMMLKSGLSLMGNVGTKLSSLGKSWGQRGAKGFQGAIKSSDAFKNLEQREIERKTRFRAGVNKDGTRRDLGGFGRFIRGGKSGVAKARSQYLRDRDVRYKEEGMMGAEYDAELVAQRKKTQGEELANEMVLLKDKTNDGANEDKLIEEFDKAMSEGNVARARAATRLAGRRKDTASNFAEKTLLNKDKKYNSEYLSKIAKEIAEGETSGNYRGASPLVFEYASQINNGNPNVRDRNGIVMNYDSWASNKANIHDALDHHVTTASELMGVQGKNLNTIVTLMDNGGMEQRDVERVSGLAKDIIRTNKENGTQIDTTKIKQIYQLAYGREAYLARMEADGVRKYIDSNTASSSGGGTTDGITISEDGSSVTVDHSKNSNSTQNSLQQNNASPNNATRPGIIVGGDIEDQAKQAKTDFDNSQRNNRNWPGNK